MLMVTRPLRLVQFGAEARPREAPPRTRRQRRLAHALIVGIHYAPCAFLAFLVHVAKQRGQR